MAGFGVGVVEPPGSATRELVNKEMVLGKEVVRRGGGWNWLRIVSNGGLWY
jgi:hypothetical protein